MWFQIQRFYSCTVSHLSYKGAWEARGGVTKPQPPQNREGCRRGACRVPLAAPVAWLRVRAAASARPCWGHLPEPLSPGDSARDRSARGWGDGGQAQEAPHTSRGRGQIWEPGFATKSVKMTLPYYDRRKNLDRGPRYGYFVWVRSVRHLERNGDLA